MEEEEDEKHSEPACPWEVACKAGAFVTPDLPLRLRLLLHRQVMLLGRVSLISVRGAGVLRL